MASTRLLAVGMMMAGVLGVVGCAAPAAPEKTGGTTQKLLAPRAIVRTGASPKTRSTLGVYEWRVYKGISDFVITGYDAKKKPVQGFSLSFAGKQGTQKPAVKVRVLDGKGFKGSYDFYQASTSGALSAKSKQLLIRAAADFTTVARYAPAKGGVSSKAAGGLRFLGEAAPAGCARNAGKFIAGGVGCAVGAATAETGAGAVLAGSACYLAADSAIDFLSSCYGGSGAPTDPNAANTFCDPGGSGFCSTSPSGDGASSSGSSSGSSSSSGGTSSTGESSESSSSSNGSGGNESGNDGAGDPSGNNQSEDPGELTNANDDNTGEQNPTPEQAGDQVDTASNETSCDSCTGQASDLEVNDANGDVQQSDSGGDMGGGDMGGGDTGGGDTGGGDMGGGGDVETAAFHRLLGLAGGR